METTEAGTIEYEHAGVIWQIPVALLEIQRRWDRAHADCTQAVVDGDDAGYREADGRRADATRDLYRDEWLIEQQRAGRRYQADQAMKHLARSGGGSLGG